MTFLIKINITVGQQLHLQKNHVDSIIYDWLIHNFKIRNISGFLIKVKKLGNEKQRLVCFLQLKLKSTCTLIWKGKIFLYIL